MLEVAQKYLQLKSGEYYKCFGKVDKVVGLNFIITEIKTMVVSIIDGMY